MRRTKKDKPKRQILIDPIFDFIWLMQFGGTEKAAQAWYEEKYNVECIPSEHRNVGSFHHCEMMPGASLIWIDKDRGTNTITHEVNHAVLHVCKTLKIDPLTTDEFFCYYAGWLSGQFVELMYRK